MVDFKRAQARPAGDGRAHRIRSEPHRLHRADQVRGRRARLHPGAAAAAAGDTVVAGEHVDVKPGNAMPLGNMPVGTIVHNVEIKIGKGGQIARSAGTYAQIVGRDQRLRHPAAQLGRAAPGARPLHGDGRRGVEPRQHEHLDRQGRPQALDGPHAAQPRRRHEPGRPSARRRRRPHLGRPPSGDAVGLPDQGQEDPQEQVHHQIHHARAATRGRRSSEDASWHVRSGRVRSSTAIC